MRISDLSRESGVPLPTLKFYLREGLLQPGTRTAPNQARYGEAHLRRLRLIRVLADVGGLSLAAVRRVIDALDADSASLHAVLGAAHAAVATPDGGRGATPDPRTREEIDAWLAALGWSVDEGSAGRDLLAAALEALRGLGWEVGPEVFARYANHADELAAAEVAYVAEAPSPEAAVEATVVGTVIFERALVALRRLAEERHSRLRLDR